MENIFRNLEMAVLSRLFCLFIKDFFFNNLPKSLAETTVRRGYNARLLIFVIIIHDPASF